MSTGTMTGIRRTTVQTGTSVSATPDDSGRPIPEIPARRGILVDDFGSPCVGHFDRVDIAVQASAGAADAKRTVVANWDEILDESIKEVKTIWDTANLQALLNAPLGSPIELTREEASEIVRLAFGRRPDLPTGKALVEEVRELLGHSLIERLKDAEQQ